MQSFNLSDFSANENGRKQTYPRQNFHAVMQQWNWLI